MMKLHQNVESNTTSSVRYASSDGTSRRRRKDPNGYLIRRVLQALDILEAFHPGNSELGVAEISAHLRVSRKIALPFLRTLERRGYVEHNPERSTYSLGMKAFEVACVFLHHVRLGREAQPFLNELTARTGETAYFAVRDGHGVTYLRTRETSHALRVTCRVGQRIPMHSSAAGKVHLAFGQQARVVELVKKGWIRALTPKTLIDSAALEDHLRASAERGYAIDDEETTPGVRCIAAPVFDHSNQIVGGIGLTVPIERLPIGSIEVKLSPLLKEVGSRLSHRLGYLAARRT
jgi:DNA-binding IclR family transcriptional regulator